MKQKIISLFVVISLLFSSVAVFAETTPQTQVKAETVMKAFGIGIAEQSDEYITKGEFARTILKVKGENALLSDEDAVLALVKGGMFPEDQAQSVSAYVSKEAAALAVTKLLGYDIIVEQRGAIQTAIWLKLFTGVSPDNNRPLTVADCYRLLYNMLDVNCFTDVSYEYDRATGEVVMTSEIEKALTALEVFFDGFRIKTRVLADQYAAVYGYDAYRAKEKIYTEHGYIDISEYVLNGYVGKTIEIYGKTVDSRHIALCHFYGEWNNTLLINMEDINYVKGFNPTDDYSSRANPCINYDGKNVYLADRFTVLYNGFPAKNVRNEDFAGEYGKVELVDTDNDNRYEIAYITDSIYFEVSSTDLINERIVFKNPYVYISTEHENVKIYSNGRKISLENISAGSFVEIKAKKMDSYSELTDIKDAQIHVLSDISSGCVTALDADGGYIEVDGINYRATQNAINQVVPGGTYDLTLSTDLVVINAKRSYDTPQYAYFVGFHKRNGFSKDVEIGFYNMAREYITCFLTDRTIFTGYDENGVWQTEKKYKRDKMVEILEANFPAEKRALLCIEIGENGDVTIVMPRDMQLETDYCGFNDEEFSLEHEIQLSEKSKIQSFGVLTDSYRARSRTKVIVDNVNDINKIQILNYGADYSAVAGPAKFMQKGYIYDTDSSLYAGVVVLQCDYSQTQNANWQDLMKGQPLVISKVRGGRLPNGGEGYIIEGYRSDVYKRYYAEVGASSEDYTTPFTAYTNKTFVSQLSAGDIVIPIIDNFTDHITGFIPLLTPDATGNSEEFVSSYWGSGWDNTGSFNAAFSSLAKNYNNKTFKLNVSGDKLYSMPLVVYVYDTKEKELKKENAGTYLYDSSFAKADNVFVAGSKYDLRFIVVYR